MNKRVVLIVAAVAAIFAAAYALSPFWAARQFKEAALSADVDRLEAAVDFPAVRDSLKSQMTVALTNKMANDPEMKANPFAGLGAMLIPTMVNNLVDGFVTADGLSAMMKRGKPGKDGAAAKVDPNLSYDYDYRGLDRFAVAVKNEAQPGEGPRFVFERRGLFTWKVIRLELPADLINDRNAR